MRPSIVVSVIGLSVMTIFTSGTGQEPRMRHVNYQISPQEDNCDAPNANISCCFVNMPATLTSTMNIADQKEEGTKLIISGTAFKSDGKTPYPNVIIYAYHTDNKGYYSKTGTETGVQKQHGRLHGWCRTDNNGYYEIRTIRPAPYPNNAIPAHIHAAVKTSDGQMYWINDFVFKDDKLIDDKYLSSIGNIGGTGIVDIKMNSENTWMGKRDIVLK